MNKLIVAILCIIGLSACSRAGSTSQPASSANNVATLTVATSQTMPNPNVAYTTVTVCVPGSTTDCQTVNNILVDTGSTGLRIFNTQFTSAFLSQLTPSTPTDGESGIVGECAQFGSGWTWGTVTKVDMYIGGANAPGSGETAFALPMDLLKGDASFPTTPTSCGDTDVPTDFGGANGIIGINPARYDNSAAATSSVDSFYYDCNGTKNNICTQATFSLINQVRNPITSFAPDSSGITDNNGVIVSLTDPSIPNAGSTGLTSTSGNLIFGIGTRSNNGVKPSNVFYGDPSTQTKNIQTVYSSYGSQIESVYNFSIFDTGTNTILFSDATIPLCAGLLSDYYCPTPGPLALTAGIVSYNVNAAGATTQGFQIINTAQFFSQISANATSVPAVIPGLAANASAALPDFPGINNIFIWGLPFFYGKNIYVGIESAVSYFPESVTVTGPYFGY